MKTLIIFLISTSVFATANLQSKLDQFVMGLKIPAGCQVGISTTIVNPLGYIKEAAHYNKNKLFYIASISKLLILLAVLEEVELGNLDLDQAVVTVNPKEAIATDITVQYALIKMISESSNYYSGVSQRLLAADGNNGKTKTAQTSIKYGFGKGIFWVGKGYANGSSYPGVSYNHEGTTSAITNFYLQLAQDKLPMSKVMREIMTNSKISNRFYGELKKTIPTDSLFRKSGSLTSLHSYSDSIMVEYNNLNFILVMLIQGQSCMTTSTYQTWHSKLAKMILDYT